VKDCEEFERLIKEGQINFHEADLDDLDKWGQGLIDSFLPNIAWQLGDVKVGQSYCLKIEDDLIGYLDILPETDQFVWCTKDHTDSFHPDVAAAYLCTRSIPGSTARCIVDDETGLRTIEIHLPDGRGILVRDIEKDGVRVIEYKSI